MLQNLKDPAFLLKSVVFAAAALMPWLFLPLTWISVFQFKFLLVALCVGLAGGVLAYRSYIDRTVSFARSPIAYAVLALPLVYAVSAMFSGVGNTSIFSGVGENDTVGAIVLFFAFFMSTVLFLRDPADRRIFLRSLLIGALLLMLVQVAHALVPALTFGVLTAAAASVLGTWHEVGIMAGLSMFFSVALYGTEILQKWWAVLGAVAGLLSAFMLVIVNMVDVWYVFGALMLGYAVFQSAGGMNGRVGRVRVIAAACIGVASITAGFYASEIYASLPQKLQILQIEVRPSWAGTFEIGRESMDGIGTTLLGSGPNSFSKQWSLYKPAGINQTEFWDVDFRSGVGFVPTTLVTVGVLGLSAWAALLPSLLVSVGMHVRKGYREHAVGISVLAGASLYLAAYHVIYVPSVALSAITFLILGAYASCAGLNTWSIDPRTPSPKIYARIAVLVIGLGLVAGSCLWALRATVSDMLVNKSAVAYNTSRDAGAALALVQRALFVYPDNERAHRAAVELGLVRLGELAEASEGNEQATAALQSSLETTIQHGLAAVSVSDGSYQSWLALASLYRELAGAGVQGAYENARAAYEQAYTDNPNNPVPLVQAAQLEMSQGNMAGALSLLSEAAKLKPDLAAMLLLRSQVHLAQGNKGLAVVDAESVATIAPEDPLSWVNLGSVRYEMENFEHAAAALEKAVALRTDLSDAMYLLGLTYERLDRPDDAAIVLSRVVELNPGNVQAAAALERVQSAGDDSGS